VTRIYLKAAQQYRETLQAKNRPGPVVRCAFELQSLLDLVGSLIRGPGGARRPQ